MARRWVVLIGLTFLVVSLNGCATARKQKDLEIQGLHNQVSTLQTQVQGKDEEISSLRDSLNKAMEEKAAAQVKPAEVQPKEKIVGAVKSRPTVKHYQIALKNAGYDPGHIDGKMGKQTRDALKAFQKENNLPANGKAGKKTWNLLRKYLYQKAK